MLFWHLGSLSNGLCITLDQLILSFQSRPHDWTTWGLNWKGKIGWSKITHKPLDWEPRCQNNIFTLCLSNLNPEDEVSSFKIDRLMTNYISKLRWAWQARFLSHILVILKNCVYFEDKQTTLVSFFDIFTGFRFPKNLNSLPIQFLSHPWPIMY